MIRLCNIRKARQNAWLFVLLLRPPFAIKSTITQDDIEVFIYDREVVGEVLLINPDAWSFIVYFILDSIPLFDAHQNRIHVVVIIGSVTFTFNLLIDFLVPVFVKEILDKLVCHSVMISK